MSRPPDYETMLDKLQRDTFAYFTETGNQANGLIPDNTRTNAPASIAAVGLALASYPVAVARNYLPRAEAIERTLTTFRFFCQAPHGPEVDATGYKGFYYHFLDMATGRRAINSELSTIDSTLLLAGALTAAAFFDGNTAGEREIRDTADALYRRADWQWALNEGLKVSHGWRPEHGFLRERWEGYNEALLLYVLALASPTYPIPPASYAAWLETYRWKRIYDIEYLYAGPLFIHQLSHLWIDFRGIQDNFMRRQGLDYFENSRRATYIQQAYARRNPRGFAGYGEFAWGITASDGPGPATHEVNGVQHHFYAYEARGVPFGPDDGTLAPWGAVASLPFAPEIVLPTIDYLDHTHPEMISQYGFKCSFNPTFPNGEHGWISEGYYGLDQGPVVLMIENYRSGLLWRLMRHCPPIVTGLRRAGFNGGWLGHTRSNEHGTG